MYEPRRRMMSTRAALLLSGVLVVCGLVAAPAAQAGGAGTTALVSGLALPAGGIAAADSSVGGDSVEPMVVSANGRYVAFMSEADTLDPAAAGDRIHIFRKDRTTGAVTLVDRASGVAGAVAADDGANVRISADGNLVSWVTGASITPDDTDGGSPDVYVRNIATHTTTLATPGLTDDVYFYDLSADGGYIAFGTTTALVPGTDTNGKSDVYRRKLSDGSLTLISAQTGGAHLAGNGDSTEPSISGDGRFVTYTSTATDLRPGFVDQNGGSGTDVWIRDASAVTSYLVSADKTDANKGSNGDSSRGVVAGTPANLVDVRVAYGGYATNVSPDDASANDSVFLRESLGANASTLVSRADGVAGANANSRAHVASISDDGHRVTWASDATNLAPNPDYYAVYVRDVTTNNTFMVSHGNQYSVQSAISGDGSTLAWAENGGFTADSEVDVTYVFARSYPNGAASLVSRPPGTGRFLAATPSVTEASPNARAISADGRYVVYMAVSSRLPGGAPGETQGVYRRDLKTGATVLVSRANGAAGAPVVGNNYNASVSADGNVVAWEASSAIVPEDTNGSDDAYVRNVAAGTTRLVSRAEGVNGAGANASSGRPAVAGNGLRVGFLSSASNLGAGAGNHAYVRDLAGGHTYVVDRATGVAGVVGNSSAGSIDLSDGGTRAVFQSYANNLDPADPAPGTGSDVYLRDLSTNTTTLLSRKSGLAGAKGTEDVDQPSLSGDGKVVAFRTTDSTLAPEGGAFTDYEIVRRVIATGANTLVSRVKGGVVANHDAYAPSVSRDGSVIGFQGDATNLLFGRGGQNHDAVFAWSNGTISGPPAFGIISGIADDRAGPPSISADGQCLAFTDKGHNAITGPAGDFPSEYVYTVSGNCPKPDPVVPPPPLLKPVVSKLTMTHRTFRVSSKATAVTAAASAAKKKKKKPKSPAGTIFGFTLNTTADVMIKIEHASTGRRVGKTCKKATHKLRKKKKCTRYTAVKPSLVRKAQGKGSRKLAFSGRLGTKKLAAGRYRASVTAKNVKGTAKAKTITFKVVAR